MAKEIVTEEEKSAKKKGNDLVITIKSDAIKGTEVMRSGDYKYARVSAKISDDEYVSITYEWKGENYIPDAVMTMMEFIKANKEGITEDTEEFAALKNREKEVK